MKENTFWKFIHDKLKDNGRVILITVVDSHGSSPGKTGFKMAVAGKNEFIGTIGGGEMENRILNQCRKMLASKKKINSHEKLYHNKKVKEHQSGLICAGTQSLFTYSLNKSDTAIVNEILKAFDSNEIGVLKLSKDGISFDRNTRNDQTVKYEYKDNNNWQYEENIGVLDTIYIIGGGHVGLALARQMDLLGFYIVVIDDRKDIKTIKDNIYADEIIITDIKNIGSYIKEGIYSYVAVVSSSHVSDKTAVEQVVGKKLKYLGLMGSAAKRKRVYDDLKSQGVEEKIIKKIHSPIGLEINSESVAEIAVSIAAEIIKIKNGSDRK